MTQGAARMRNLHCPLGLDRAERHETPSQSLKWPQRVEIAAFLAHSYPGLYRTHPCKCQNLMSRQAVYRIT